MKYFFQMLSSEIRNSINLIYFLLLMGNAGYVCVSVKTHTFFVWVQTDLDVTQHVSVSSNKDVTFLCILPHISPKNKY